MSGGCREVDYLCSVCIHDVHDRMLALCISVFTSDKLPHVVDDCRYLESVSMDTDSMYAGKFLYQTLSTESMSDCLFDKPCCLCNTWNSLLQLYQTIWPSLLFLAPPSNLYNVLP